MASFYFLNVCFFYIYIKGILAQIFNGYSPENEKTFKEHMLFYLSVDAVGGENMAQLYFNDFPEIGNVRSDQIRNQKTKTKTKTNKTSIADPSLFL